MLSVDIVSDEIRKFWHKIGYTCEVIVFFEQKYEHEKEWREYEEYASPHSSDNFDRVYFPNDFCEGERQGQNIKVMRFETAAELLRSLLEWGGE